MEEVFKQATFYLASAVEAAAGLVIGLGAIEAAYKALLLYFIQRSEPEDAKDAIRVRLGRWLALALEFELAADILRTAVAPTWEEIGKLAAIIVLRTVLNYFLQKEIEKTGVRNSEVRQMSQRSGGFSLWPKRNEVENTRQPGKGPLLDG